MSPTDNLYIEKSHLWRRKTQIIPEAGMGYRPVYGIYLFVLCCGAASCKKKYKFQGLQPIISKIHEAPKISRYMRTSICIINSYIIMVNLSRILICKKLMTWPRRENRFSLSSKIDNGSNWMALIFEYWLNIGRLLLNTEAFAFWLFLVKSELNCLATSQRVPPP